MSSERLRILVVHIGGLTETTLALPALRSLRHHFPDSHISIVTSAGAAGLLPLGQCADEILPVSRFRTEILSPVSVYRSLRVLRNLRESMFDLVIELHRGRESSLVMKMVNARNRVTSDGTETTGLARLIGRISSVLAARPASPEHLAQRYLRLIEPIGVRPIEAEPRLTTDRESDIRTEKWLEKGGIRPGDLLVGVHPGAGPRINRWPLERFTSVGRRLIHNFSARLIVIGGPSERGIARQLSKEMPARQSLVLQSPQLPELVSLLARLSVLITNHSGPAHVAAALRTPVVVASSMNVPAEVNLLSKTHIPIRGISADMILEEDVYEAACRLIKASRSDSLWTR